MKSVPWSGISSSRGSLGHSRSLPRLRPHPSQRSAGPGGPIPRLWPCPCPCPALRGADPRGGGAGCPACSGATAGLRRSPPRCFSCPRPLPGLAGAYGCTYVCACLHLYKHIQIYIHMYEYIYIYMLACINMDIYKYFLNSTCSHPFWQPSPESPLLGRWYGAEPLFFRSTPRGSGSSRAALRCQTGVLQAKPPAAPGHLPAPRLPPGHRSPVWPLLGFAVSPSQPG